MDNDKIIRKVYEVLESRRDNPIDSYTSNIMQDSDKKAEDKILEKIAVNTIMIKRGLKKLQSIPNTESLYFAVKSFLTNCFNRNFFSEVVSNII